MDHSSLVGPAARPYRAHDNLDIVLIEKDAPTADPQPQALIALEPLHVVGERLRFTSVKLDLVEEPLGNWPRHPGQRLAGLRLKNDALHCSPLANRGRPGKSRA